jgi:hypothetical protein
LKNLRWLCPNCNSQQKTFAGRNRRGTGREYRCLDCGIEISRRALRCKSCAGTGRVRVAWPPLESLLEKVRKSSYAAVGRELGVTGNAVKKHIQTRT